MADKAAKKAEKEAKAAQKKKDKEEKAAKKAKAKEEKAKAKAARAEEKKKAKEAKGKADKGKEKEAKAAQKKKDKEEKAAKKAKAKEEKAKAKAARAEEKKKAKEAKGKGKGDKGKAKADKAEAKEKDAAEGAEGKKKGIPKVALLAVPGVLTVLAVAVFVFRIRPMMEARRALEPPPGQPPLEEPFPDDGQRPPDGEISPDGQTDGQAPEEGGGELGSDGRPLPQPLRESRPQTRSTGDSVAYVLSLSPQVFGLAGDSLDEYDVLTSAEHVMIDGSLCAEIQIYSRGGNADTNRIEGTYYIAQEGERKLYRVDRASGLAVEIPLPQEVPPAEVQTDSAGETEGGTEP